MYKYHAFISICDLLSAQINISAQLRRAEILYFDRLLRLHIVAPSMDVYTVPVSERKRERTGQG